MLEQGVNAPHTSSAGRWFDAAAGLLGVRRTMSYEGQAAMELEGLAMNYGEIAHLDDGYRLDSDNTLDLLPVMAHLAESKDPAYGAALFHATLVQALADWILKVSTIGDIPQIVLGGGCFLNRLLSKGLRGCLEAEGLSVYEAGQLPPNDGGLSLGQAWVAMTRAR
jgi:hydrogenase maturation protein HypF